MPGLVPGTYLTRPLSTVPPSAPDGEPWAVQPEQAFNHLDD